MKSNFKWFIVFLITISVFLSCVEDDSDDFSKATTIKVINFIKEVPSVIVKTGNNSINYATASDKNKVSLNAYENFSIDADTERSVEIVPESDTLNTIYSELLSLKGIHSLYLLGDSENVESLLLEDNVKQFTDSIVGIRFINLSNVSGAIDIGVAGETAHVISGLDYKSYTDYIEFPAKAVDGSYAFEFKDASGNVLKSVTFNPLDEENVSVKKNLTLALTESVLPFGVLYRVTQINNYQLN